MTNLARYVSEKEQGRNSEILPQKPGQQLRKVAVVLVWTPAGPGAPLWFRLPSNLQRWSYLYLDLSLPRQLLVSLHANTNQYLPCLDQSLPNQNRNLIVLWKSIAKSLSFHSLGIPPQKKFSIGGGFGTKLLNWTCISGINSFKETYLLCSLQLTMLNIHSGSHANANNMHIFIHCQRIPKPDMLHK